METIWRATPDLRTSEDVKEERIMTSKRTSIPFVALLIGLLLAATAEAEPIDLRCATSAMATAVDTNGDTQNVTVSTGQCVGPPQGRATIQGQNEFRLVAPPGVQGPNCDVLNLEMELAQGSVVVTGADLSQWAGEQTGGFLCVDVFALEFTLEADGMVIGGSGRLENATGAYHI
ncbi:MAG: hypothetical protein ACYTGV_19490, partial [Planctomycetota bacterium]